MTSSPTSARHVQAQAIGVDDVVIVVITRDETVRLGGEKPEQLLGGDRIHLLQGLDLLLDEIERDGVVQIVQILVVVLLDECVDVAQVGVIGGWPVAPK